MVEDVTSSGAPPGEEMRRLPVLHPWKHPFGRHVHRTDGAKVLGALRPRGDRSYRNRACCRDGFMEGKAENRCSRDPRGEEAVGRGTGPTACAGYSKAPFGLSLMHLVDYSAAHSACCRTGRGPYEQRGAE